MVVCVYGVSDSMQYGSSSIKSSVKTLLKLLAPCTLYIGSQVGHTRLIQGPNSNFRV